MTQTGPTVFIVDDDESVRKALARVIRAAGVTTSTHASARDFLDQYDPSAPGCLLLDLSMPDGSGLDLQQELVSRGGAPPVVFLSGNADVPASIQAMQAGAVEFLTKPVDAATLLAAVQHAIERDREERRARGELVQPAPRLGIPS